MKETKDISIRRKLLREAEGRVSIIKSASLEKESMATHAGQVDANNSAVNFRFFSIPTTVRIDHIANVIKETFAKFMKSRTGAVGPELSSTGQPVPRATSQTPLQPLVGEVPNDDQTAQATGLQGGSIYFRYGYKRTIMPSNRGDQQSKAETLLDGLNRFLAPGHTTEEFIESMENNFMPLLSYCHISQDKNITSAAVTDFIQNQSTKAFVLPDGKKINNPLQIAAQQAQEFSRRQGELASQDERIPRSATPYSFGARYKPVFFENKDVTRFTSHSILLRMLIYKMAAGYTVSSERLFDAVESKMNQDLDQFEEKGYVLSDDVVNKVGHDWEKQYEKMVHVLNFIQQNLRSAFSAVQGEVEEKVSKEESMDSGQSTQMFGFFPMKNNGQGASTRKMRVDNSSEFSFEQGGKQYKLLKHLVDVNFGHEHLQLLLANCTDPAPYNRIDTTNEVDPNYFIDPSHPLKWCSDGMSDSTVNELTKSGGKTIGLPPLAWRIKCPSCGRPNDVRQKVQFKTQNAQEADTRYRDLLQSGVEATLEERTLKNRATKQHEQFQVLSYPGCLNCNNPFTKEIENQAQPHFDFADVNMGGKHLAYNGEGIINLLHVYGEWSKQSLNQLKTNINSMPSDLKNVVGLVLNGFFGAEALQSTLSNEITDAIALQNSVQAYKRTKGKGGRGTPFRPNQKEFGTYKNYAYYVAKMMDVIKAIIHYSCRQDVKIHDKDGLMSLTRFGQNYSTSSGVGGGGEILLSVKYAYKASFEEFAGEHAKIMNQQLRKQKIPTNTSLISKPNFENVSNDPDKAELINSPSGSTGPEEGVVWSSALKFFVGMKSSISEPGMERTKFTGTYHDSWADALEQFRSKYPDAENEVGDPIWNLSLNIRDLEAKSKKVLASVAQEVGKQLLFKDNFEDQEGEIISTQTVDQTHPTQQNTQSPTQPNTVPTPAVQPQPAAPIQQTSPAMQPATPAGQFSDEPTDFSIFDDDNQKPMESPQRITRKNLKHNISKKGPNPFTQRIHPRTSALSYRLLRLADKLDARGCSEIADQLDLLSVKLIRGTDVSETS